MTQFSNNIIYIDMAYYYFKANVIICCNSSSRDPLPSGIANFMHRLTYFNLRDQVTSKKQKIAQSQSQFGMIVIVWYITKSKCLKVLYKEEEGGGILQMDRIFIYQSTIGIKSWYKGLVSGKWLFSIHQHLVILW